MALLHATPKFAWNQFGDGEVVVMPRKRAEANVTLTKYDGADEVASKLLAQDDSIVSAGFGVGKTIRVPSAVAKSAGRLVMHVVPARNLAYQTYLRVREVNPTAEVQFVDVGKVPEKRAGLLLMSASQYVWLITYWRACGEPEVPHVLYLDEAHQCNWATAVLRTLKSSLPGVTNYAGSSATHGHGGDGEAFEMPARPGDLVRLEKYTRVSPMEWDMVEDGKPWSASAIVSDTIVFCDDEDEACVLVARFREQGFYSARMNARTPPAQFGEVVKCLGRKIVAVLVLDSSYRDGYNFMTIGRIIDVCKIRVIRIETHDHYLTTYRDAYAAEISQAAERGGRGGKPCVYYRPDYKPEFVVTDLEGAEADVACVFFRVLGFKPPRMLENSPYYSGGLPASLPGILMGETPLRMFAGRARVSWPGAIEPEQPLWGSVVTPPASPVVSPVAGRSDEGKSASAPVGAVKADQGPVLQFDVSSDEEEPGGKVGSVGSGVSATRRGQGGSATPGFDRGSSSEAKRKKRTSSIAGTEPKRMVKAEVGKVPAPREGLGLPAVNFESLEREFEMVMDVDVEPMAMLVGKFYYFPGAEAEPGRYGSFSDVVKAWNAVGWEALAHASPGVVLSVDSHALKNFNETSAMMNVIGMLVPKARKQAAGATSAVATVIVKWVEELQKIVDVHEALAGMAASLLAKSGRGVEELTDQRGASSALASWREYEKRLVAEYVGDLTARVALVQRDEDRMLEYGRSVSRVAAETPVYYGHTTGRVQLDLASGSFRQRVAGYIMGTGAVAYGTPVPGPQAAEFDRTRLARRFDSASVGGRNRRYLTGGRSH